MMPYIAWPPMPNPRYSQMYESIIRPLIYPDWDLTKWQADKPLNGNYRLGYETILAFHDPKLEETHSSMVKEILETVDQKYINNKKITGFVSDFYEI
jgi:hypothetical protein